MKFLFLISLLVSELSFAQVRAPLPSEGSQIVPEIVKPESSTFENVVNEATPVSAETEQTKTTPPASPVATTSSEARENSFGTLMVGYQLITSWLPSKKSLSYTHIFDERWSLEGEYSFASLNTPYIGVDLGEVRERRYTLHARRYVSNSFHFTFGVVLSDFKARLGSDIPDTLGNSIQSSFSAQNFGLTGGIGNRWQWNNGFTLGVDWIRLNVPVFQTKVEDNVLDDIAGSGDRDDVKKIIRTFNRIPTFVLLGLNIGYTF